jgi:hypothetical protein
LNFARWKYTAAMKDNGGPIARVTQREINLFGTSGFEAYAYLDLEKIYFPQSENILYGTAHGSGTSDKKKESVYRAISEALERWAWLESKNAFFKKAHHQNLGFTLNTSTDGFAAYPGFFPNSARKNALYEAAERWAITHWWENKLSHSLPSDLGHGIKMVSILIPLPSIYVTIIWKDLDQFRAYGFSGGKSADLTVQKAMIELDRNIRILSFYQKNNFDLNGIRSINERRLIFFGSPVGAEKFDQRVQKSIADPVQEMRLIVDSPVIGGWTKYTHVWRCLFDSSQLDSSRSNENVLDYFFF